VWCAARRSSIRQIQSPDSLPEIAFSVEACVRRQGRWQRPVRKLIAEARSNGYHFLRITTARRTRRAGARQQFGAHLTFRHGESTGSIDLRQHPQPELARYASQPGRSRTRDRCFNRAYWKLYSANVRLGPTA